MKPVPAMEVMICVVAFTIRILGFPESVMRRSPSESTASPFGALICADVAAPPSPFVAPGAPGFLRVPAYVEMFLVVASTLQTISKLASAMNTLPVVSTATPTGWAKPAPVAAPLGHPAAAVWEPA